MKLYILLGIEILCRKRFSPFWARQN